jgi:hypothetical protein
MTDDVARARALADRLDEKVDSGRRTLGGGSIGVDGKPSMWGGERIMVHRNPDGPEAATLLRSLAQQVEEMRKESDAFQAALASARQENRELISMKAELAARALAAEAKLASVREMLKRISDMCPATCDMSTAHMMAAGADEALSLLGEE